jgi:hypothetical protein
VAIGLGVQEGATVGPAVGPPGAVGMIDGTVVSPGEGGPVHGAGGEPVAVDETSGEPRAPAQPAAMTTQMAATPSWSGARLGDLAIDSFSTTTLRPAGTSDHGPTARIQRANGHLRKVGKSVANG